jgi:hypothetical protein
MATAICRRQVAEESRPCAQVFVEEAQEFQVGVDDSRYRRRTRLSSAAGIKAEALTHEESPSADAIQIMMQWYCRCLQNILLVRNIATGLLSYYVYLSTSQSTKTRLICLQEEVAVLQMQCGLGASLSSVTRRIWLRHVAVSGILTGGFARYVLVLDCVGLSSCPKSCLPSCKIMFLFE